MIASICLILLINQIPSNTQWKEHVMEEYVKTKTDKIYKEDLTKLFEIANKKNTLPEAISEGK